MSEQTYFQQFVGDAVELPIEALWYHCPPRRNIGRALFTVLKNGGVNTIEDAKDYINNPNHYSVRQFGIGRRAELYGMLQRFDGFKI